MTTLGDLVRSRRMELGLSQTDLAYRLSPGRTQANVSLLERDRYLNPSIGLCWKLTKALGLRFETVAVAALRTHRLHEE